MQSKSVLICACIGLWCVVNVQSQVATATTGFAPRPHLSKEVREGVKKVFAAGQILLSDVQEMLKDKNFNATAIQADFKNITDTAAQNGVVIPAETKTLMDEFMTVFKKMIADNKVEPKVIREKTFEILNTIRRGSLKQEQISGSPPSASTASKTV